MFIYASFLCFIAFLFTCGPREKRWERYENRMLGRGLHVIRTPQWDRFAMQQPGWFLIASLTFLLVSYFASDPLVIIRKVAYSPLTLNEQNVSWSDYHACGPNPPATCPPYVMNKYSDYR